MKHIEGFVCICIVKSDPKLQILFGRNMGQGTGSYENFYTSALTPFESLLKARKAQQELLKRDEFCAVSMGEIIMDIAETLDEVYSFKGKRRLVVLKIHADFGMKEIRLRGPGKAKGALPGVDLVENRLKTFNSFRRAEYVAREVNRQGGVPASIATFKLRIIRDS